MTPDHLVKREGRAVIACDFALASFGLLLHLLKMRRTWAAVCVLGALVLSTAKLLAAAMATRQGCRKRLRAAQAADGHACESSLARLLLESWSWGFMSAPQLQAIAAAAEEDFERAGANCPSDVQCLAAGLF